MAMRNTSLVSSAETVLPDGFPVFHDIGSGVAFDGVRGNDDTGGARQTLAGVAYDNDGSIAYNDFGKVLVWGHTTGAIKAAGTPMVAGTIAYAADNGVVFASSAEATVSDSNIVLTQGNMLGIILSAATSAATTFSVFVKKLGM